MKRETVTKILMLLVVSAGITIAETIMVYFSRTKGPMPFKIKFLPDFDL
jgi:hypothetical protein